METSPEPAPALLRTGHRSPDPRTEVPMLEKTLVLLSAQDPVAAVSGGDNGQTATPVAPASAAPSAPVPPERPSWSRRSGRGVQH